MASRIKHMKRSRRSYHDRAWQNSLRRTAFLRERDKRHEGHIARQTESILQRRVEAEGKA